MPKEICKTLFEHYGESSFSGKMNFFYAGSYYNIEKISRKGLHYSSISGVSHLLTSEQNFYIREVVFEHRKTTRQVGMSHEPLVIFKISKHL